MKSVKETAEYLNVSKQTIHYHLKHIPPHLNVEKTGNKTWIDDALFDYLKQTLNKKTTKESTKNVKKRQTIKSHHNNDNKRYISFLEEEIRQKNRQIDDLTIALKQAQSLNLNSQNILSHQKSIESDERDTETTVYTSEIIHQDKSKQSLFSKLFRKK
ncbi:replication-associated family protein [Staphylococcus arlettae]|uniref:replication-associated family protein n=1 Tax=Staphylococcus arlettae TaxID=29378 RepID=UPI001EDEFA31|nr:replication-associated family protein [Staphylococcus arlettae]MCP8713379.1 replication-associated family protein [Staphylococcus arlettae]MDW4108227.1 replication-associated family protein [Staphylococcus saprophyticus]MDW4127655.1 replication-associated family protein [Staphylococcus saprophyticus]